MTVAEWMTTPVMTLKPGDSLWRAHERLAKYRINQFPVVHEGKLVGIITDRDVRDAYPSELKHLRAQDIEEFAEACTVGQIMTRTAVTISPQTTIREAAQRLRHRRIGALPVVDGDRLVGILTRGDVLDAFLEEQEARDTAPAPGA
ncbi:MAG: CBS domain-containing protein [Deltaproteobacteria bacterium]|nr:CBS domain-containing protein [Deltaproteobacteria bacterium]